jgi:hypothetical protein
LETLYHSWQNSVAVQAWRSGKWARGLTEILAGVALGIAILLIVVVVGYVFAYPGDAWSTYVGLVPREHTLMIPTDNRYLIPSVVVGILVQAAVLATAIYLSLKKGLGKWRWYAAIALVVVELWFYIPRGYGYRFMYLESIPVAVGIAGVWSLAHGRWRLAAAGIVLAAGLATAIDLKSPYGYPERQQIFRPAPYVEFLKANAGYSRIMATDGVLMPNSASAFELYDVRYINSMTPQAYNHYAAGLRGVEPSPQSSSSLWFTGLPGTNTAEGDYDSTPLAQVIEENLRHYSFLGVKYFVTPASVSLPNLGLVYEQEVNIYENPEALPRAFIVSEIKYLPSYGLFKPPQQSAAGPEFEPLKTAVLEELPEDISAVAGANVTLGEGPPGEARIIKYEANRVVIQVDAKQPGVLVLTDNYYPGWQATIDGQPAEIYRVNGLVRGLFVKPGDREVEFYYFPASFKRGLGIAFFSLLVAVGLWAVSRWGKWPVWHLRQ